MQSSLRFLLCDFGTLGHKDVILIILGEVTMRAAIVGAASLGSGFGFEFFSLGFGLQSHWTMRYFGGGLATSILSDIGRGVQCFLCFFGRLLWLPSSEGDCATCALVSVVDGRWRWFGHWPHGTQCAVVNIWAIPDF